MKKLTMNQLSKEILEDGYMPSIEKGEIFLLDGKEWICTKRTECRFKAERFDKKEALRASYK